MFHQFLKAGARPMAGIQISIGRHAVVRKSATEVLDEFQGAVRKAASAINDEDTQGMDDFITSCAKIRRLLSQEDGRAKTHKFINLNEKFLAIKRKSKQKRRLFYCFC